MTAPGRVPFRDGFLTRDLADLDAVHLAGSTCNTCGIALFGERHRCENCSSRDLRPAVFAPTGTIFTYTVQRYPPPQPHAVPEPWTPRPLAWIDLDKGPRVMGVVDCEPETVAIGSRVRLRCEIGWIDAEGCKVVSYKFEPAEQSA